MDYELGRLAEELIASRYTDKLEVKDNEISKLKDELSILQEGKTYVRTRATNYFPYTTVPEYIGVDQLTEEYKVIREAKDKLAERIIRIENCYKGLSNTHNKFIALPWYKQLIVKLQRARTLEEINNEE